MSTDETFTKCGEIHFVLPHSEDRGNSSKCIDCRYFVEDVKSKELYVKTGKCRSEARRADRTHVYTGRTNSIGFCHWWFPIGKVTGEQEDLYGKA